MGFFEQKPMKKSKHPSQSIKMRTRLFSYTEQEEMRIERAMREAELYFKETFGKGRQPQMINRENYF